MADNKITIPQYFAGKHVFITGGTGFMGKVLIEKLLRCCPDVAAIYVLIRGKKGKTPEERVKALTGVALFDTLKSVNSKNLEKIVPIVGDVTHLGLGIRPEDRQLLIDNVHIIYHAAASVRFDDPLKEAIIMNTRGTREAVYLAQEMKNLDVFVHVSTSYANSNRTKVIGECMYPPQADWREAITLAETADDHTLNILTQKFMGTHPNTYTFTKNLAEHVVEDLCQGTIPSIVYRPSIVISTAKDPIPGWIDNFNGPVGILIASGKGILRSVYSNPDVMADYMPVDIIIKGLVIGTWLKGLEKDQEKKLQLMVYNACNNNINNVTLGELVDMGKRLCWDYPLNDIVWYPKSTVTQCYVNHYLNMIFFHVLPALLIDGMLKVTGHKPMLLKIQRKIYIANMALQYFITHDWIFENQNTQRLDEHLAPGDVEAFDFDRYSVDPYTYFTQALMGARQYLLGEDVSTFENAKRHSKRMWAISHAFNAAWYCTALYLAYEFDVLGRIVRCAFNFFDSL